MLPTVSSNTKILRPIPKLPEISCDQDLGEEDDDDDSIEDEEEAEEEEESCRRRGKKEQKQPRKHHRQCENGFESDEDIEILLRKTKFLRHSKSAHADLALPTNTRKKTNLLNGYGIEEEKDNSSSDSDEEFYVHQSLLPFRKSKSSTLGFEGIEAKTVEIKNLGTFKASKVLEIIEKQTAEMLKSQEPEVATFVSNTIDYWPPPEDEAEQNNLELHEAISRRISKAKKSIVPENESHHGFPLIPFGRTASVDSDGIVSVGAWSAPAQVASDSDEGNSEDEIIGGQKMRSWSATERPCTIENEEEKFCTKKGISLSCERSHHCIYDEIVDELWKGHLSCDDLAEPEISYTSDSPRHIIDYNQNPFNCIQDLEEFNCSPGLHINLQTPSSFTPSPVMSGSKSDSALRFYASDRPKTPLCGEPNPSNSTQEIYDPWHSDADEIILPQPPGPIRSRSCHDTFESTGTDEEARMLRHCQMCPSPDCKQIIEKSQKLSVRDTFESESNEDEDEDEEDLRIKKVFEAQIEKMQQFAAEGETASLLVHHEDDASIDEEGEREEYCGGDNGSFTVFDDEIPMADDLTVESPLNAYLVKKFILSRSSPPMASEDDLSDIEMTEIGSMMMKKKRAKCHQNMI
uniref:Uncharacterized protein n=1 Tax=Panagrolaimus superbus TaxID=310955 RepID=A0A914YDN9_9BILA